MVGLCGVAIVSLSWSGTSAGATTPTVPDAPTVTSVRAIGLNSITVAFTKPADDGGARIVSYRGVCASMTGGVFGAHHATHSPIRVPALTANKTYTCTVTATNAVGAGPVSARSSPVVARPTSPAAPTITSVQAGGLRTITVAFRPPAADGGAPIRNYRATCTSTNGAVERSREGEQSPISVAGLTAAQTYTCTVSADNRVGVGRASTPSSRVVARPTVPGAPTITSVQAGGLRTITVAFVGPARDGGAPIKRYVADCTSRNGGASRFRDAARSPIRVAGLSSGKTYTCTVAASNDVRLGPASPPSKPVVARSH
jgi:hypothetical protein